MTYTLKTDSFNDRRYGRPWIAEVNGKDFRWGQWEGRNGEAGELRIDADPGALIAQGQKDLRKGKGGVDTYYLAMPNGKLYARWLTTEVAAKRAAREGWKAYARMYMHDVGAGSEHRYAMARMLGEQCPIDKVAALMFGLEAEVKEPANITIDAFGL